MLVGMILLINSILSVPINDYQSNLIKYMFIRYLALVDIIAILIVNYIEQIEDKLG